MNDLHEHTVDTVASSVASVASKTTYVGAGTSFIGWLATSEAGVVVGVLLGVIGFAVNFYFKRREDRRQQEVHDSQIKNQQEAHDAQMRAIRGEYL